MNEFQCGVLQLNIKFLFNGINFKEDLECCLFA